MLETVGKFGLQYSEQADELKSHLFLNHFSV